MKLKSLITKYISRLFVGLGLVLVLCCAAAGQKLAILSPGSDRSNFVANLSEHLTEKFKVLDGSMTASAFHSASPDSPFNMTAEMSRNIGQRIGCDSFILVRTINQRRASLSRGDFFEASAAVFVISTRSGSLIFWRMQKFEDANETAAASKLDASAPRLAADLSATIPGILKREITAGALPSMEEVPLENTPEAKNFRSPVPYKRIKPLYTAEADLFAIAATVDLQLDLDEKGNILRTDVVRWAGYGLDESVIDAVRKMTWRPAERDGKPLPLRVLLRYNFKKIEKDE